jgi:hypothetical protein
VGAQNFTATLENNKHNTTLQSSPPWYLPKLNKNLWLPKTCMLIFMATLLITQNWKQFKCPSNGKETNYGTSIQKTNSSIKKNKIPKHATTWINLNSTWPNHQTQKATCHMLSFIWHSWKGKTLGTKKQIKELPETTGRTEYTGIMEDFLGW